MGESIGEFQELSNQNLRGHGHNEEDVFLPSHLLKICQMSAVHGQLETFDQ